MEIVNKVAYKKIFKKKIDCTRCMFAGLMVSSCEFHSTDTAMARVLLGTTKGFPAGVFTFLLSTVI